MTVEARPGSLSLEKAPDETACAPVVVLGMHRSGTTATAAALEHLGFTLGRSLFGPNEWNRKGYLEDREIVAFNDDLLRRAGRRWDAFLPPDGDVLRALADRHGEAGELLRRVFGGESRWAVKDPRLCLLGDFWSPLLREAADAPRYVIVVRDPEEVAGSLARRDGISPTRAAWMWWAHVRGALAYATRPGEATFVAFADLLERPAESCRRLATWLGIEADEERVARFAEQFIEPALARRGAAVPLSAAHPVRTAFALLREAAANADPHAFSATAEWRGFTTTVDAESLPLLRTVAELFHGDGQLDLADRRITELSRSLANAERVAHDRLTDLVGHDDQLRRTSAALATAERLAGERLEECRRLAAALSSAERVADERLTELAACDDQLRRTSTALATAERLAGERLEECRRLAAALSSAERVAEERLTELAARDDQLRRTSTALATAERLAGERLEECRQLADSLAHAEQVAHAHQSRAAELDERLRGVVAVKAETTRLTAEGGA